MPTMLMLVMMLLIHPGGYMRVAGLALLLVSPIAGATTTICQVKEEKMLSMTPSVVSWDTRTRRAKGNVPQAEELIGRVTRITPHNAHGVKVNLEFHPTKSYLGDVMEIIVFPMEADRYRMIGVQYDVEKGVRYLSVDLGGEDVTCSTL